MPKQRSGSKGQSLVEFALILPIFILMTAGLLDGAWALFNYSTVSNAAREGARIAIVNPDPPAVEAGVRDAAVGLRSDRLTVTQTACTTLGCEYVVTVEYQYESMVPLLGAIFSPLLSSTVAMPVENPPSP